MKENVCRIISSQEAMVKRIDEFNCQFKAMFDLFMNGQTRTERFPSETDFRSGQAFDAWGDNGNQTGIPVVVEPFSIDDEEQQSELEGIDASNQELSGHGGQQARIIDREFKEPSENVLGDSGDELIDNRVSKIKTSNQTVLESFKKEERRMHTLELAIVDELRDWEVGVEAPIADMNPERDKRKTDLQQIQHDSLLEDILEDNSNPATDDFIQEVFEPFIDSNHTPIRCKDPTISWGININSERPVLLKESRPELNVGALGWKLTVEPKEHPEVITYPLEIVVAVESDEIYGRTYYRPNLVDAIGNSVAQHVDLVATKVMISDFKGKFVECLEVPIAPKVFVEMSWQIELAFGVAASIVECMVQERNLVFDP